MTGAPKLQLCDKNELNYKITETTRDSLTERKSICWHLECDYMMDGLQVCLYSTVLWYHMDHNFVAYDNLDKYL